jgi:hypothetical protein
MTTEHTHIHTHTPTHTHNTHKNGIPNFLEQWSPRGYRTKKCAHTHTHTHTHTNTHTRTHTAHSRDTHCDTHTAVCVTQKLLKSENSKLEFHSKRIKIGSMSGSGDR